MLGYQLDFEIEEGNINTFLIGSKSLFEKINVIENLLAKSIDVEIKVDHKLIELENKKISYQVYIDIKYSSQNVLGNCLSKEQIVNWFREGIKIILTNKGPEESIKSIELLAKKLNLIEYFLYVQIQDNILKKSLDDLEKLSILLFNKLDFFEI